MRARHRPPRGKATLRRFHVLSLGQDDFGAVRYRLGAVAQHRGRFLELRDAIGEAWMLVFHSMCRVKLADKVDQPVAAAGSKLEIAAAPSAGSQAGNPKRTPTTTAPAGCLDAALRRGSQS